MRRLSVVGVLVLGAAAFVTGARGAQEPQFRSGTHTVSVFVTALDSSSRLVPNLTKDDFEVYDNGKLQSLSLFSNDVQPITIVIMLDRSGSMVSNFTRERDAAEQLVANLLKTDKARLGSFSERVQIDPPTFTSDPNDLIRILHMELLGPGATPLWSATSAAMTALAHQPGRRVVLVFTDGYDNPERPGKATTFADVLNRSLAEEIMVYAIGLADSCGPAVGAASLGQGAVRLQRGGVQPPRGNPIPGTGRGGPDNGGVLPPGIGSTLPGRVDPPGPGIDVPFSKIFGRKNPDAGCASASPDPGLKELAAEGGGGYFELRPADDLGSTFARVADELHHQYLLAFTATVLDGRTHSLEVRVRQPNLVVRARRSYVAPLPDKAR